MIEPIARIRIELQEIEPNVWRRVDVPLSSTLLALHDFIQFAFRWTDSHLFEFEIGDRRYGQPGVRSANDGTRLACRTPWYRGARVRPASPPDEPRAVSNALRPSWPEASSTPPGHNRAGSACSWPSATRPPSRSLATIEHSTVSPSVDIDVRETLNIQPEARELPGSR